MSNYLPWYGKKRARFAECEKKFLKLLQNETNQKKLRAAAEAVHLAKLRSLKAKRAQYPPSEKFELVIELFDREIRRWSLLTIDEVIAGYGDRSSQRDRPSSD